MGMWDGMGCWDRWAVAVAPKCARCQWAMRWDTIIVGFFFFCLGGGDDDGSDDACPSTFLCGCVAWQKTKSAFLIQDRSRI